MEPKSKSNHPITEEQKDPDVKVARELAEKEISDWLDQKRVRSLKRVDKAEHIETLVRAVMYGDVVYDKEKKQLVHNLICPLVGEFSVAQLRYKMRLTQEELANALDNVTTATGTLKAYIRALTGELEMILSKLDVDDYMIATAVARFFI